MEKTYIELLEEHSINKEKLKNKYILKNRVTDIVNYAKELRDLETEFKKLMTPFIKPKKKPISLKRPK